MSNETLTAEELQQLPEGLREKVAAFTKKQLRLAAAQEKQFGNYIWQVRCGEKRTTLTVTNRPADGSKREKGTFLTTLYRPAAVIDLAENGGSFNMWLRDYALEQIEAGNLLNI